MWLADSSVSSLFAGDETGRAGTPQMQWANLPESWGVFVLIAIIALVVFAVIWLYRKEQTVCPMPVKLLLAGLRTTVMLMLVLMLLKPSMFYQQINEIKPNIDLVRDSSLSFARGDKYRDPKQAQQLAASLKLDAEKVSLGEVPRSEMLNKALADPEWLQAVRDKGSLQVIDFADGTDAIAIIPAIVQTNIAPEPEEPDSDEANEDDPEEQATAESQKIRDTIPELSPEGLGTDIWQALRSSLDSASNLAAILLVSDGQHNGSEDPIEMARQAAALDIPIYVVGIGDPNPPRNISVAEVFVRNKTYPDEPFEIEALLQASSFADAGLPEQVAVELIQRRINEQTGQMEPGQKVQSLNVSLPENGGRARVDFAHTVNQPGRYVYTVQVETVENEINTEDNARQSSEMEVVDEKVRVLLVSGLPSWDYQQVQRLLQRDQTIDLSCWLQSMDESRPQEGNLPISRLPRTIEELGLYNVILLMDPNPEEFDSQWIEALQLFCRNKAGGVLFMAGPQYTSEFVTLNRLKGIRDILPVRMGDMQFIDSSDALMSAASSKANMSLVRHNLDHPVLSFHSDQGENERRWASMPGIYWNFPVKRPKPTTRVLMERGDQINADGNTPLMATGRYGAGSVLYMGFQGTFRWRSAGLQSQFFDRFWIQVVRYLIENRSLQGSRRGFVDSDKTEYELGDRILFVGRVLNEQFRASEEPSYPAKITNQDGRVQNVEMQLLPGGNGQYEGNVIASRTGIFQATIALETGAEAEKLIEPITYRVVAPKVESSAFWLNEKLLREIADKSGGKYFRLDELDQLPEALPKRVQRVAFKSPARPLWDWNKYFRFFAFLLPVVLLSAEWAIRKWYKLL